MIHCNGPVRLYCVLTWFGELCEQLLLYNYALIRQCLTTKGSLNIEITPCRGPAKNLISHDSS